MDLLKDNFKLIFVVSAMVIIGVGTLIYDVNKPSLSGGVANIIKIGDTAIVEVNSNVNLKMGIDDLEGVEFACSIDNEKVAKISDCEVSTLSSGTVNAKIEVKDSTNGEVLDEKTVAITINKAKMNITNVPSNLTLDLNEEYTLKPNTNGIEVNQTYEYDESMLRVIKNDDGSNTLVALKEGNATFKMIFTPVEQNKYESAEKTINITIKNVIEPAIKVFPLKSIILKCLLVKLKILM